MVEHSCFKYPSLYFVKHPNFDLMHSFCFSRFVLDEFIAKGGENMHKVVGRTLLLTGG
jgi:hypothetical protein